MTASVLVTGGAGFVGSHACKALATAGYRPVTFDNLSRGHQSAVCWGPLVEGDLKNPEDVRRALARHDCSAILHFAALAYVGESMEAPERYFANNVVGSLNLLEAARQAGVTRLVFSSTCATYGHPESVPIDEDHPQHPVNPYGESKLFVERALQWYERIHGLHYVALRYFNAAGADPDGEIGEDHEPETHLVPIVVQAALGLRENVQVLGSDYPTADGTAVRDYVHVSDLADAHVRALAYLANGNPSVALNLGTGQGRSVRQVIDAVARVSGRPVPAFNAPRRPGDPAILVADPSRARRVLDWTPVRSGLDEIVGSALSWQQRCAQ